MGGVGDKYTLLKLGLRIGGLKVLSSILDASCIAYTAETSDAPGICLSHSPSLRLTPGSLSTCMVLLEAL